LGAIGLVNAIRKCGGEQIVASLGEGCQQKHRILNIGDRIGTIILSRENAPGLFSREGLGRQREQQWPFSLGNNLYDLSVSLAGHAGHSQAAGPARGGVVGMTLAERSLADNPALTPIQTSEMHRERNSSEAGRGGGTAALPDGNLIVDPDHEWSRGLCFRLQDLTVGIEHEAFSGFATHFYVATSDGYGEVGGGLRLNFAV